MSNFKKLLSMLLAIVMICSTFAVGAQAAYADYKDDAITGYDSIDQPIFTAAQLASLSLDAIDAMLADLDETSIKIPVINVTLDYSSIDTALDSLENIYNGTAWKTIVNIAGDLGGLQFKAINTTPSESFPQAEGCRRTTAGKTDVDVLISVFNFIGDNAALLASYGYGTLDLGATLTGILEGFLPEINAYLDAPNLLKGLIYDLVYDPSDENGLPEWDELSAAQKADSKYLLDNMVQLLVDDLMVDLEGSLARSFDWGITMNLSGVLDIDAPNFYDVFEAALQRAYNEIFVPLANTKFKKFFYEFAGVEDFSAYKITKVNSDGETETIGYYLDDCADIMKLNTAEYNFPKGNSLAEDVAAGNVKLNTLGKMLELNYEIADYDFAASSSKQLISELNNILGTWLTKISKFDAVWESGTNDKLHPNIMALVREFLKEYGEQFLSEWITIPSEAEINELETLEDVVLKFGPELLEQFAPQLIIPADAMGSVRSILSYALCELIADKVPEEDIYGKLQSGAIDPNGDEGWKAIVAVIVRYYLNAIINVNIPAGLTFEQTVTALVDWALNNYGGILNYAADLSSNKTLTAWEKLDEVIFGLIPMNWLPATARVVGADGNFTSINITSSEQIILDVLLGNILDLRLELLFDLFMRNPNGELNSTPINVILGTVRRILNAIIPGAMPNAMPTLESIITNKNLGDIIKGLLSGLKTIAPKFVPAALPLIGMILELTSEQELEDPAITYPDLIVSSKRELNGTAITIRNASTGVNTAWTDASGKTTQDDLYKVVVKSIKADNSAVTISYNAGHTLNGGEAATFPVTGKLAADGLVTFTVSYEILNELGKSLTAQPIEVMFYTYVSAVNPDDDESYYEYDEEGYPYYVDGVGMNNHYIVSAPAAYVTSWGELADQSFTIGRDGTQDSYMPENASVTFKSFTTTMPADASGVITAPDFENFTTGQGGYFGSKDFYKVEIPVVGYDEEGNGLGMPFEDAIEWLKENKGDAVVDANLTLTFGATATGADPLDYTITRKIVWYDDHDLYGIVGSALDANRQKANYATSGTYTYVEKTTDAAGEVVETTYTVNAANAWNKYTAALAAAQTIVLKPKTIDTFDASVFEAAAANLKRAAADLDACALSAGVGVLEDLREQYQPSNPEGMQYNDPAYNFMGSEDYVLYTWDRYVKHRDRIDSLIESQYVAEPGEDATAEEWEAYYAAVEAIPTLKQFDITYRGHMYEMNAQRLVRRTASKNYLNHALRYVVNEVAYLNPADYSDESWSDLQNAIEFAQAVMADNSADLRQTKVNDARHRVIDTFKGLTSGAADPADFEQLNAYIAEAQEIFNTENYEEIFTGLEDLQAALDDALAVDPNLTVDDQGIVDELAAALRAALDLVERVEAGLDFTPAEDILGGEGFEWIPEIKEGYGDDGDFQFIDGFMLDCGYAIEELIGTTGGASYEYTENENNAGQLGTGDMITLDDGTVYYIVIYADVNGDGTVDPADSSNIDLFISGDLWDATGIKNLAADINCDTSIDPFDAQVISMFISGDLDYTSFPQDGSYQ
ncbi:MAG: hypothetical protein IJA02_11260 [Clostridia bacterium]|nr:hypothetical protein [Clostridia bacterium]